MITPSGPSLENLTLSDADLAACQPVAGEGGGVLRALCPFHSSDHQRSLRVTLASGHFVCFACGAWGSLAEVRQRWQEERPRSGGLSSAPAPPAQPAAGAAAQRRPASASGAAAVRPSPRAQPLAAFQAALLGRRGAAYLRQRGLPLALAQQLGVGYAAPGSWPHKARDWRGGRVVFPHTTPDGRLVNLYGRAVGTAEQVPKAKRHAHLPGAKGSFNAARLAGAGPLWVCEGACEALALMAAGVPAWWRSAACRAGAGPSRARYASWSWRSTPMPLGSSSGAPCPARRRGKRVAGLPPAAYGGLQGCERSLDSWCADHRCQTCGGHRWSRGAGEA